MTKADARTWIVATSDDSGLITQCLLALEDRFDLPPCVAITPDVDAVKAAAPANLLAFVNAPASARVRGGEVLREEEAAALLVPASERRAASARPNLVAVTLDSADPEPVDKAVRQAVTTLIDWGHEIAYRRKAAT